MVVIFVDLKRGPIGMGVFIFLSFFLLIILYCFVMLLGTSYYMCGWCGSSLKLLQA